MKKVEPPPFADEKEFSRKMQDFMRSEHYGILKQRLSNDLQIAVNSLIEKEDPITRGKIQYIKEILSWFKSKAEEEEVVTWYEEKINEDW